MDEHLFAVVAETGKTGRPEKGNSIWANILKIFTLPAVILKKIGCLFFGGLPYIFASCLALRETQLCLGKCESVPTGNVNASTALETLHFVDHQW